MRIDSGYFASGIGSCAQRSQYIGISIISLTSSGDGVLGSDDGIVGSDESPSSASGGVGSTSGGVCSNSPEANLEFEESAIDINVIDVGLLAPDEKSKLSDTK